MNLLSIVTISKDDYLNLKKTLKSTQLLRNNGVSQLIVDSSGGVERQKIERLVKKTHNATYLHHNKYGISSAFNRGIDAMKPYPSRWIWFLNSGDIAIVGNRVSLILEYLKTTGSNVTIFEIIHGDTRYVRPPFSSLWPPFCNWIPHPGTLVKEKLLLELGKFDENLKVAMDGDYWFRLMSSPLAKVDLVSFPIAQFDTGGISSRNTKMKSKEMLTINLRYLPLVTRRALNQIYLFFKCSLSSIKEMH